MITVDFCSDADGSLSMVTHHQILRGVATLEEHMSELNELYSYMDIVMLDEVYLSIGGYTIRVKYIDYSLTEVYISSNNDFGTFQCVSCSLIITPNEVYLKLYLDGSKRYTKRLLLK